MPFEQKRIFPYPGRPFNIALAGLVMVNAFVYSSEIPTIIVNLDES